VRFTKFRTPNRHRFCADSRGLPSFGIYFDQVSVLIFEANPMTKKAVYKPRERFPDNHGQAQMMQLSTEDKEDN
jgi:hypothetical protein